MMTWPCNKVAILFVAGGPTILEVCIWALHLDGLGIFELILVGKVVYP